jgi:DNA-binding SARP family transcriptional activator/tetratricopeptide (TPR) repeat protein
MTLRLTLLGGFEARVDGGPPVAFARKKAQALLAYLALPPDRAQPRDKLAALLWGDLAPEAARHSLRQALLAIRQALPANMTPLVSEVDVISLTGDAVSTDVADFARFIASGDHDSLSAAADLYHGDLLAGIGAQSPPFEEWLLAERARLHELAIEGLARLLAHQMKQGPVEPAIRTAARILMVDPLQEPVHRTLMRLYARHGRRSDALRQYQVCLGVLRQELGAEPERETRALYEEVLRRPEAHSAPRQTPTRGTVPIRETALVGREAEIVRLRHALDEASRGRGSVATIIGEAGIGKSRLVSELIANALEAGHRVLLGRSHESEQILPFAPWIDVFRGAELTGDPEILDGLAAPWRAEIARLVPELATGAPAPADSEPDPARTFESVVRAILHLAAQRPVLLVLEDLQWADDMTLRLLAFMTRRIARAPVLLAVTARAEDLVDGALARAMAELERSEGVAHVDLGPLTRDEMAALVRAFSRTGTAATDLVRIEGEVWAGSDGNPFVVIETVRALQEGAQLRGPAGLSLPERVRRVVSVRLASLGEPARQLLAPAAVIGRPFGFELLALAAGVGEAQAALGLEELVRRRVLQGTGERFDFVHDHVRRTVLDELLAPRRRLCHAAVAEALERLGADASEPLDAALGDHYFGAAAWERAVEHLRHAGHSAAQRGGHREAVARFDQALAALDHVQRNSGQESLALDLLFDLRNSLVPLGQNSRVVDCLERARARAEDANDSARLARAEAYLALHHQMVGDPAGALAAGERALALAARLSDPATAIVARQYLGQACHAAGDFRRAAALFGDVIAALDGRNGLALGVPFLVPVFARAWGAMSFAEIGEFQDALALGAEAGRLAAAADRAWERAAAGLAVGHIWVTRGEPAEAIAALEAALPLAQAAEIPGWAHIIASSLAYARVLAGRVREGRDVLEAAASSQAAERSAYRGVFLAYLAEARLLDGDLAGAAEAAIDARDLARARGLRGHEALGARVAAAVAAAAGETTKALQGYAEAAALAERLEMRPLRARVRVELGMVWREIGERERARAELTAAVELLEVLGMNAWLVRARDALGIRK